MMGSPEQRPSKEALAYRSGRDYFRGSNEAVQPLGICRIPPASTSSAKWNGTGAVWRTGEFYKSLSLKAIDDFESLVTHFRCDDATVLFSEGEKPSRVLFLMDGRAKLSINSTAGKRLILGIAEAGDVLGIAAAVSGYPSEITAEAQFPCRLASLPRQSFLDFLLRNPFACFTVGRLLGLEHKRACEQLRILGLTLTASIKLARLLVEWCADGRQTERGIRIQCPMTHEEIGECIGVARETVSRTLTDFKNRKLVQQHGSTMFISSLRALEVYAGRIDS